MAIALQIRGLKKRYGTVAALAGIDLSVDQGSILALLGPNGAGKSTLIGCLLGLTRPTAGVMTWKDAPITDAIRTDFGYTPERMALYPHRSLWENGLFFAGLRDQGAPELERQLERVGLRDVRERKVRQLSKGMLQRLGLAIALCGAPDLLVLDEPFNGLDPVLLEGLQSILQAEQRRGATLLISTHTISAVESLATHLAVLLQGTLATAGPLDQVRASHPDARSLEAIYYQVATRQTRHCEGVLA
jgi:ABC-2 type transport system ATP-binding protein